MNAKKLFELVKANYPELTELPKPKLKLVQDALKFAIQVHDEEVLSPTEHRAFLATLGPPPSPGRSLQAYRLRSDLTQKQLAKKSGIAQSNISAMEKGKRPIGLNVAKNLATILRCDYKKLI